MTRYEDILKAAEEGIKAKGPTRAHLLFGGAPAPLPTARVPMQKNEKGQNRTEAAYDDHLTLLRNAGEIRAFWWDAFSIKIGQDCRYRVDFLVQRNDGTLEIHETKGHMEDDALVKIKAVRSIYPFPLFVIKRKGKEWTSTEIKPW